MALFCWKGILWHFSKFKRKYLCRSPFFNKGAYQARTFIKKETPADAFLWILKNLTEHLFYKRRTTASGRWHFLNNYWKLKEIHHKKIYFIIFNNFSQDIRILWNLWTIQISYLLLISDFVTFLEESVIRKSKLFCKKRYSGL